MAVDPKDLAKKNVPLIVIYVLALVPIGLWFVMVQNGVKGAKQNSFSAQSKKLRSNKRKIDTMIGKINDDKQRVYTDKDVKQFEKQHEVYKTLIGELRETLASRDGALEKWFPEIAVEEGKQPKANDYITLYERKILELTSEYADVVSSGDGGPPQIYRQPPNKNQLVLFQKRYWIQKYLLDALVKGTAAGKARGVGAKVVQSVRFAESTESSAGGTKAIERHDVNLVFTCSVRDVPTVVEKILAQPISMQIRSLRIQKEPFVYDDPDTSIHVDGRGGYFADVYYTGELKDQQAFKGDDKQEHYIPEPPVRVSVDLQVLDFEIAKPEPKPAEPADDAPLDDDG